MGLLTCLWDFCVVCLNAPKTVTFHLSAVSQGLHDHGLSDLGGRMGQQVLSGRDRPACLTAWRPTVQPLQVSGEPGRGSGSPASRTVPAPRAVTLPAWTCPPWRRISQLGRSITVDYGGRSRHARCSSRTRP